MTSPIQRAYAASRGIHKQIAQVSVTLTRNSVTSDAIKCTVGFSTSTSYDDDATHYARQRDYLIDVSDYFIVAGTLLKPARYDVITELLNGIATTYQVVSGTGESFETHDDKDRTVWRVHTKEK